MSKIAIILCVALFATAANASFWSNEVHSLTKKTDSIVATAISQIRAKFELVKQKAVAKFSQLEEAAQKVSQKLSEDVSVILQKVRDGIQKMAQRAKGTDVSACTELVSELDRLSIQTYSEMSRCFAEKIQKGVNYVDNMRKHTDSVYGRLTGLRDEGLRCSSNVSSPKTALQAVFCIRLVAAKAAWTAAKSVPAVSVNLAKMSYLLATVERSLSYCGTSNALQTLSLQSSIIVKRANKCVEQKIAEATANKTDSISDSKPQGNNITSTTEGGLTTSESSKSDGEKGSTTQKDSSTTQSYGAPGGGGSSSQAGTSTIRPSEQNTDTYAFDKKEDGTSELSKSNSDEGLTTQNDISTTESADLSNEKNSPNQTEASTTEPSEQNTNKSSVAINAEISDTIDIFGTDKEETVLTEKELATTENSESYI